MLEEPGVVAFKKTYFATLKNSVGSKLWRNFYMLHEGAYVDVLHDGNVSCAYYVSSILYQFRLIAEIHTFVDNTVTDMLRSGWIADPQPCPGAVIVWEPKTFATSGETHKHIGFYLRDNLAVSHSDKYRSPILHPCEQHNGRRIALVLWHPALEPD